MAPPSNGKAKKAVIGRVLRWYGNNGRWLIDHLQRRRCAGRRGRRPVRTPCEPNALSDRLCACRSTGAVVMLPLEKR